MSNEGQVQLSEKVANLPTSPGVYIYRDSSGTELYVGKAKKLRNRVRSYFQDSRPQDGRIKTMVSKIDDIEVVVTDSEAEALILENNLIKQYQPRYNIMYRDDKSYPYICITDDSKPRVFPTRTVVKDGSKYYGPYDSVGAMKRMLETIRKAFGLCTCAVSQKNIDKTKGVPKWHSCFDDYLQNCSGDWDDEVYQATIHKVDRMLNGQTDQLIRELKDEMQIASDALEFEQAAQLRDSLEAVKRYSQKMKMVVSKKVDRDVFAIGKNEEIGEACGVLFKIREGKMIGKFHRFLKNIEGLAMGEMLQSFVEDYYTGQYTAAIPDEVYLSHEMQEVEPLEQYLHQERGKIVPVHVPQIGEKKQLIKMALANAKLHLNERALEKEKAERNRIPHAVKELKEHLKLDRLPRRIECFDNSNLQGTDPVASMVCFVDARPRKSEYKRFNIKTVEGPDDFASMKEVLTRRYSRVQKEGQHIPDLIIVDGGKGQLSSAVEALKEIDFYGECEIIGLAKRLEEVFLPGMSDPIMIPKKSSALKLLQQARDEAHRFAITFHRKKRSKRTVKTELLDIDGVGEKTAQKLLMEFGSVKKIKKAKKEELQFNLGKVLGEKVYNYFNK
ncbi:MAG: excinuclease ABC subunit C [Gracilimonas sp.]|uniref:excinuclease ABC subunit UvrC n=1 Tax=Gracilimonas sp. TaxID=1974203 RepID=UPI001B091883|nr:excinuclease ABC subunit UvrC [Gracilimonas sp.]MBO6586118.1 excinuclease ABC subunit C [Gracilimonas sp.]MBO6614775.1 excinuclease ABC subunit C [Gracilimonas sp.]